MKEIIALYPHFLGMIAISFFVCSIQFKEKNKILLFQLTANVIYAISYVIFKAYSAVFTNIISALRCLLYSIFESKNKKIPIILPIIFILISLIIGFYLYENLLSLLPILISIIYIISAYQKNQKVIKVCFIICGFIWFYFNFKVQAYICMVGNVFEIISGTHALSKLKKRQN